MRRKPKVIFFFYDSNVFNAHDLFVYTFVHMVKIIVIKMNLKKIINIQHYFSSGNRKADKISKQK